MKEKDNFSKARNREASKEKNENAKGITEVIIENPDLFTDVSKFLSLTTKMKKVDDERQAYYHGMREKAKEIFLQKYNEDCEFPGSMQFVVKKGKRKKTFTFVPLDKTTPISAEDAKAIRKEFGRSSIQSDIEYSFNKVLFNKYRKQISDLIEKMEIDESDKKNLIVSKTKYSIKKGLITELRQGKFLNFKLGELYDKLKYIFNITSLI